MSRTKLKLCPFCSGKAKIHYDYSNFALVQCSKCGIGTLHKPNEVDGVKEWNTRKPKDKFVEQLDLLREKAQKRREEFIELNSNNNVIIKNIEYERGRVYAFDDAIEVVKDGGLDE